MQPTSAHDHEGGGGWERCARGREAYVGKLGKKYLPHDRDNGNYRYFAVPR